MEENERLGLPTAPGLYRDKDGYPWMLLEDGRWSDNMGVVRGTEDNWMLPHVGPFEKAQ